MKKEFHKNGQRETFLNIDVRNDAQGGFHHHLCFDLDGCFHSPFISDNGHLVWHYCAHTMAPIEKGKKPKILAL